MTQSESQSNASTPLPTFKNSGKADLVAGFLVFLIALPLCLGIAKASGFPPIAGVMTAVVGGLIAGLFSNSELTIKGPAAGMIAVVAGAMIDMGFTQGADAYIDVQAYRYVLAIGVVAGVLQMLGGMVRFGSIGEIFPMAPVHGLLASIGLIIIAKQIHPVFGAAPPKEGPIECYRKIPETLLHLDTKAALIGVISLVIMFAYPAVKKRWKAIGVLPAQVFVLVVAIPLGVMQGLTADKLVSLPAQIQDAIVFPDFHRVLDVVSLKWILMFMLVGSLESLLSAKAIDLLDPWKRKTNMNRDLFGVGVANTLAAFVGGLPMISEILRSSANITAGRAPGCRTSTTAYSCCWPCCCLAPLVKLIPVAALGAMLVYAGYRLAAPTQFFHQAALGKEQLVVFCITIAFILPEGHLLDGIAAGIAAELILNYLNGSSLASLFRLQADDSPRDDHTIQVHGSVTFINWMMLKRRVERMNDVETVTLDFTDTVLVDHTAMEKLLTVEREFTATGRMLVLDGLDDLRSMGTHPSSGRRRRLKPSLSNS